MSRHVLPPDMPEAAARYVGSLPPGRVELFCLTGLDRIGVPCWNALFLPEAKGAQTGESLHGVGYGSTDAEAMNGTMGELAEAVHAAAGFKRLTLQRGSTASLRARLGHAHVADPLGLCLPAGSAVDHDTELDWVEATRWPSGESVLVPAEMAACSAADLRPGASPLVRPITNGLGAGPSLDFALAHGVGELLQRDGNGLGFRAMDRGIALDLGEGPEDSRTRTLLATLADAGIEVMPKFASDEFGVANVYVVGGERDAGVPFPLMITACGEAASLDREHALRKAVLEFAAARARKAFSHMPLARIAQVAPPGYVERFRASHSLTHEEPRALRAMQEWCAADVPALRALLEPSVLSRQASHAFDALPVWHRAADPSATLRELASRLAAAGMEILFLDFSPPGASGVHVVKVIVPGLEVETMSYHRIGARGAAKLLERGSPLVGFGPPPDGALPIRMPPEAAARLGGVPWLDVRAVDRIVGGLYPLYREPLVHSAAVAMELENAR